MVPGEVIDEILGKLHAQLKNQKRLFIKEINRIFTLMDEKDHAPEVFLPENSNTNDPFADFDYLLKSDRPENWVSVMIILESTLLEMYNGILLDKKLDEIAKMILSNHVKEISRDLHALRHLKEMYEHNLKSA